MSSITEHELDSCESSESDEELEAITVYKGWWTLIWTGVEKFMYLAFLKPDDGAATGVTQIPTHFVPDVVGVMYSAMAVGARFEKVQFLLVNGPPRREEDSPFLIFSVRGNQALRIDEGTYIYIYMRSPKQNDDDVLTNLQMVKLWSGWSITKTSCGPTIQPQMTRLWRLKAQANCWTRCFYYSTMASVVSQCLYFTCCCCFWNCF